MEMENNINEMLVIFSIIFHFLNALTEGICFRKNCFCYTF